MRSTRRSLTSPAPGPSWRSALNSPPRSRCGASPQDKRHTSLRSALDRAWRWAAPRGVPLSGRAPLDLLSEAIRELVQSGDNVGPATAELATLASYHLVGGAPSC